MAGPTRAGRALGTRGGPFLLNNTNQIVAVNTFSVHQNCTGNDGAYRIDQPDDLDWLAEVLAGNPRSIMGPFPVSRDRYLSATGSRSCQRIYHYRYIP
jgi:hypothetical protein